MNIRQTQTFLWYTGSGLMLTAVSITATIALWPYDGMLNGYEHTSNQKSVSPLPPPTVIPNLSTFAKVWSLNLRRPLHDRPTPMKRQPVQTSTRPISARLAGTVVEPGHSIAMFVTKTGKIDLKSVGEMIDDAEILEITQTDVSVRYHGQVIELRLERKVSK